MRRVPFISLNNNTIKYICPSCKQAIPRDLYIIQDWCPNCNNVLNRSAKSILKVYKKFDCELYTKFHK